MINSFLYKYNLRIIQEYFQPEIEGKIRTFSLGGEKKNILIRKREGIELFNFPTGVVHKIRK